MMSDFGDTVRSSGKCRRYQVRARTITLNRTEP